MDPQISIKTSSLRGNANMLHITDRRPQLHFSPFFGFLPGFSPSEFSQAALQICLMIKPNILKIMLGRKF